MFNYTWLIDQPIHTEQQELTTMQPHVCAQPHVHVIVIDVKCYIIIQPQHVKCKQNGRWANYFAFILENTDRSRKIAENCAK